MVAKITTPERMMKALNYNEQKVKQGQAVCLSAVNFLQPAKQLSFHKKLERFEQRMALNSRTKVNTVHISLNFDPSEKLEAEQLQQIADDYMERIGFGDQPYLVYRHFDAGHPHIHILTTNIQADGSRISLHNIGKLVSEPARKAIESEYSLVRAEDHAREQRISHPAKLVYGQTETRRGIANVLNAVLEQYNYTSLPELNAILNLYNVAAERGEEDSRTYRRGGLVYRVLDDEGKRVGVPVKASILPGKPVLSWLQARFEQNAASRNPKPARLRNAVDMALLKGGRSSLQELTRALEKEGISLVQRRNDEGVLYGVTYVDHRDKLVFNGSALGKGYSAKGLQERLSGNTTQRQENIAGKEMSGETQTFLSEALHILMRSEYDPGERIGMPKKKRKKRGKGLSNDYL